MRIAIIGRSEILYDTALLLKAQGHSIAVIVTAKEAPEYTRTADDFRALAESEDVPFYHAPSMRERNDTLAAIAALAPIDIAVSYNYTGVIAQTAIDLFPLGILNAHGGDLPRYRGNACQAWAMLNGEERIGLCVHRMVGGELDSGDIVAREYFPLTLTTKIGEVHRWMQQRVPVLFAEAVAALAANPDFLIERQSTDPADALRCFPRNPSDGRIDWSHSALHILRLINASGWPYAGAFCAYEGERVVIHDAAFAEGYGPTLAVAGQVMQVGDGFVDVACGEGALRLRSVTWQGHEQSPDRFIRSIRKRLGVWLHD